MLYTDGIDPDGLLITEGKKYDFWPIVSIHRSKVFSSDDHRSNRLLVSIQLMFFGHQFCFEFTKDANG
jgi:hypothetical protein